MMMKRFYNEEPTEMNPEGTSFWKAFKQMIKGVPRRRPEELIENEPIRAASEDHFIWLGHSSLFLQLSGQRILVDPVFSKTASPLSFLGPKAFEYKYPYHPNDFPDLDLILISHDHYDHLDRAAIRVFKNRVPKFWVPTGVGKILEKWGVASEKITELHWGENRRLSSNLEIVSQTSRHFSGRGLANRNSTLWCSYVIRHKESRIFFSGDSGYGSHFRSIGQDFGPFDLAFLECGQYNENWPQIHMLPEETVQAALDLGARKFVPIHWGKFALSLHAWDEPPQRAEKEAATKKQSILLPRIGVPNPI